jgi:hypothetical protein
MKRFSKTVFLASTLVISFLLIPSFLAAFAEDEGTLGTNFFWIVFAKLFYILRFPTHTLLWSFITKGGAGAFFGGLVINCMFYGFLIERLFSVLKRKE